MVATLTRIFGVHNLALAEDVVQDAFCRALEAWKFRGVPENPSAWLMATAKHRALDVLRRERTARNFAPDLGRLLESEWTIAPAVEELFGANAIKDDQLRMMFSCCNPRLAEEAQVALVLHILCGFSVHEIANAFVSSDAAIEKRISRAKKELARSKGLFDLSGADDFLRRLAAVQRALYLLFNEGYHGASPECAVRAELCHEALRLTVLLLEHPLAATPAAHALAALMCLHAARLPARIDLSGNLSSLFDQDRSRWDSQLVTEGQRFLDLSATGSELTEYHVEAAIASVHAMARRTEETDWGKIVSLYNTLITIRPSPVVHSTGQSLSLSMKALNAASKRFMLSPTAIASPPILSIMRRSVSSNFAVEEPRSRASTSTKRSTWHETPWSAAFSSSASARVNARFGNKSPLAGEQRVDD